MAAHTITGFMADVTAAEITVCGFAVAVFALVAHPVSAVVGYRFLMFVTVNTIPGVMADGATASVMAGFDAVAGGFPAEIMVFGLFRAMTFLAESLAVFVAIATGGSQA